MTRVLTQRGVEAAKPSAKRYGKRDGLVPGLQLTVQPSGVKSYTLFARVEGGKQVKLTIGAASVLSLAQARQEARRLLTMVARGEDPRAAKQALQPSAEVFEVVARRFVERHAKVHTRRWRATERLIER